MDSTTPIHPLNTELRILGSPSPEILREVLTPEAQRFLIELHRRFNPVRKHLLKRREMRQVSLEAGALPSFLPETESVRSSGWKITPAPKDLLDRRVEITGPAERKMMINALNSGANAFMADFEDSLSPTWDNVMNGQLHLKEAVRRTLSFQSAEGKSYRLREKLATLLVRPRGWHLEEAHILIDGDPASASLVDFGLYFFNNAHELIQRGTGPYFYLPKMESHLEARLWNDVFVFAQERLGIPQGTIRTTVLIETILAAFEMEEILFELKDHASGLNAGRWDYLFSLIKKFRNRGDFEFPDRSQLTMSVPFMRTYAKLLVNTCHRRGAHAIGGMSAFVPSRKDVEVNQRAFEKVREDKERESQDGFDGTWVAHPDLVPLAREVFDRVLAGKPNQIDNPIKPLKLREYELIDIEVSGGKVTEAGLTNNIDVALIYLSHWLDGTGAVTIHNLMEDAATAEIARAELWHWIRHRRTLDDGRPIDRELFEKILTQEIRQASAITPPLPQLKEAASLLHFLVLSPSFSDFLTLNAYPYLTGVRGIQNAKDDKEIHTSQLAVG